MVLKPEQERVRTLLVDTITLLCKNGLNYQVEFNINALIGITLDHEDVFLVDIRETVKSAAAAAAQKDASDSTSASKRSERTESQSSKSQNRKRRKEGKDKDGESSDSEAEITSAKKKSGSKSKDSSSNKSSATASASKGSSRTVVPERPASEPPPNRSIKQEIMEGRQPSNVLVVKPEPGYNRNRSSCDRMPFPSSSNPQGPSQAWDQHNAQSSNVPSQGSSSQNQMDDDKARQFQHLKTDIATGQLSPPQLQNPASNSPQSNSQLPQQGINLHNTSFDDLMAMFSQTPDGLFLCPICQKGIKMRGLRTHANLHLGKYRYYCHICRKGMSSLTTVKDHLLGAHGLSHFKCAECDFGTDVYKLLKIHMTEVHNDTGPL